MDLSKHEKNAHALQRIFSPVGPLTVQNSLLTPKKTHPAKESVHLPFEKEKQRSLVCGSVKSTTKPHPIPIKFSLEDPMDRLIPRKTLGHSEKIKSNGD